jgi:hypothetical protein
MLTTIDNPHSPFKDYASWYSFDVSKGYNTCAYLARIAASSDELSEVDEALAIDHAMNEIVDLNISGFYLKVSEDYVPRTMEHS